MSIGLLDTRTKKIRNPDGTITPESITSLEKIILGGLNLYIDKRKK